MLSADNTGSEEKFSPVPAATLKKASPVSLIIRTSPIAIDGDALCKATNCCFVSIDGFHETPAETLDSRAIKATFSFSSASDSELAAFMYPFAVVDFT